MKELNPNKRIDDFLMDRLSPEDRTAFLQEIEQDEDLRQEVDLRELMLNQIDTIGDIRIKDRILKIQKDVETEKKPDGKRRYLLGLIAAAAVAVLLFFLFNQIGAQNASPEQLFTQNYQAYNINFGNRSANPQEQEIVEAGAFYRQKKYTEVITAFEKLNLKGVKDDRVDLGLAIAYLETNQNSKAQDLLKTLADNSNNLYQDQAQWYLALSYLKAGKLPESSSLLQKVSSNPDAFFQEKATNLLQQLNSVQ